jgi:uncharacterized protein YjiS (DUF1127 family)
LIYRNAENWRPEKIVRNQSTEEAAVSTSYPFVADLIDAFGNWLQRRREIGELQGFDSSEFNRIAHELGVSTGELHALVREGPHAADELPKLLTALGIDSEALLRIQPLVYHDMERVCSTCLQKKRCNHELAAGSSPAHYEEYCINASTIDAIVQKAS